MIRIGFVALSVVFIVSCASPPVKEPVKEEPQPVVEKSRLPDRPLAFGEEYVFSIDKADVSVASLDSPEISEGEECLISQSPDDSTDNIIDFMHQAMKSKWIKPHNLDKKYQCDVALQFSANGCVTDIDITGCKDNIQLVRSIESALFRSAPIPSVGGALAGDRFQFEFFAGP